MSSAKKRELQAGVVFWELLVWTGLIAMSVFGFQTKLSSYWREKLNDLQKLRIPYTGRALK